MTNEEEIQKAYDKIPYSIKNAAESLKPLRLSIMREINRNTDIAKADIIDWMNRETELTINVKKI